MSNGNKPGSWVKVTEGSYAGAEARTRGFVQEKRDDGTIVPDGLKYYYLQGNDIPPTQVFRRDELLFIR